MALSWKMVFSGLLFSCIFLQALSADNPAFPHIADIEVAFYQTEVKLTDLNLKTTVSASEYYDGFSKQGKVDLLVLGNRQSVYYYSSTDEILEVNSTSCQAWETDISIYDMQALFYGWLSKDPLVIGPSAPLWFAQNYRDKIKYVDEAIIRDIKCDKFSLLINGTRDNVTLFYYFAKQNWTTPYQMTKLRVPIRIEARGLSSKQSPDPDQWYTVNQYTDFAFFKPTISDWLAFQVPVGLGCRYRKASGNMPAFPKIFKYAAEMYDVLKAEKDSTAYIEFQQVFYDSIQKMARLDKYTQMKYTSELYDFNTGVTYSIQNMQTCSINPLRYSLFEGYGAGLIGHMKDPDEVLNLDGTFYEMGSTFVRGIWADVYESLQEDIVFMSQSLKKLVITIYFTKESVAVSVDGETERRIPVYYRVRGWETATKVAIDLQYNVFRFDDVIYPDIYTTFRLGRCFPQAKDKSYFVLIMGTSPELSAVMESQDDYIVEQIKSQITFSSGVSEMRLPMLRVDYKETGVYVTALMLDRPPAIKQFWLESPDDERVLDPNVIIIVEADTKEKCAIACVGEDEFACPGFYMCNNVCFLQLEDGKEDDRQSPAIDPSDCDNYLRAERNSDNKQPFLADALKRLEYAVLNQTIKINVIIDKDKNVNEDVLVSDIVLGDGPGSGRDTDKPYKTAINNAKLKLTELTMELPYIDTMVDCYKACKASESIDCASFSYCARGQKKQCILSPTLIVDNKSGRSNVTDDKLCNVYSLNYMDFYLELPGLIVLLPGEDTFDKIQSREECAQKCRNEDKFQCRGFEYCRSSQSCILHSKHVVDLKDDETSIKKKPACTHYSAKFSADYYDKGFILIKDDNEVKRESLTLEDCARACSEELKDACKSFNYCPASGPYVTDSSCAFSKKLLSDDDVDLTIDEEKKCRHYEKKKNVDDWVNNLKNKKAGEEKKVDKDDENKKDDKKDDKDDKKGDEDKVVEKMSTSGYTTKGFTGLVIGMLALGIIIGVIGFVAYSYFRSRSGDGGMSVRFMKQET